jgi:hypothetical protein
VDVEMVWLAGARDSAQIHADVEALGVVDVNEYPDATL